MTAAPAEPVTSTHRNEILLVGEVSTTPAERVLANGRDAVTFRLDVRVHLDDGATRDSFEITLYGARLRRSALTWDIGDVIQVEGVVRRKFHKVGASSKPFTVIEADRARRVRRS